MERCPCFCGKLREKHPIIPWLTLVPVLLLPYYTSLESIQSVNSCLGIHHILGGNCERQDIMEEKRNTAGFTIQKSRSEKRLSGKWMQKEGEMLHPEEVREKVGSLWRKWERGISQTTIWGWIKNATSASSGSLVVDFCLFLPPSLPFPSSGLVGYNAGSQPALQTDGPLIRCASALPLLPAARFLIKLKPKEEGEGERNRGREKQRGE